MPQLRQKIVDVKVLIVLAFFGLLEYQVMSHQAVGHTSHFTWAEYSAVTAGGLMILSLYQLFIGSREFKREVPKKENNSINNKWKVLIVSAYIAVIVGGSMLANNIGQQFAVFLIATICGVGGISMYEFIKRNRPKSSGKSIFQKPSKVEGTRISAFTIPILYLYVVNFLIAAQLGRNLAFQFILILSCIILYDNLSKEDKFVKKFKNKVNDFELRHYIFHRWSKYFDFFLGTWYFISLHINGVISLYVMLLLIFLYMSVFFTVLLRITYRFNIRDFIGIIFLAAALTVIPALIYLFAGWEVPAYAVAAFIFFGFDLGDIYWHSRHFAKEHKATKLFWFQKVAIYTLVVVFIWQINQMETNDLMNVDNIYASVFNTTEVEPELVIEPSVNVQDVENATHVRGE